MTRWYKGFRCKGDPETIRNIVVKQVHDNDLACFVTSVKPEKIKKNKNKGARKTSVSSRKPQCNIEFYLFVAIESDEIGKIPSLVESQLVNFLEQREQEYKSKLYKIIQWSIPEGFISEEIKGMTEADFDVYSFTQSIPYKPHQRKQFNDNFFELLDTSSTEIETIPENYCNYEKFLYLLSTLGQGTWETFKRVCQTLELEKPRTIQRQLFAQLVKESASWNSIATPDKNRHWWNSRDDSSERISQWQHSRRPHAIRAVILCSIL